MTTLGDDLQKLLEDSEGSAGNKSEDGRGRANSKSDESDGYRAELPLTSQSEVEIDLVRESGEPPFPGSSGAVPPRSSSSAGKRNDYQFGTVLSDAADAALASFTEQGGDAVFPGTVLRKEDLLRTLSERWGKSPSPDDAFEGGQSDRLYEQYINAAEIIGLHGGTMGIASPNGLLPARTGGSSNGASPRRMLHHISSPRQKTRGQQQLLHVRGDASTAAEALAPLVAPVTDYRNPIDLESLEVEPSALPLGNFGRPNRAFSSSPMARGSAKKLHGGVLSPGRTQKLSPKKSSSRRDQQMADFIPSSLRTDQGPTQQLLQRAAVEAYPHSHGATHSAHHIASHPAGSRAGVLGHGGSAGAHVPGGTTSPPSDLGAGAPSSTSQSLVHHVVASPDAEEKSLGIHTYLSPKDVAKEGTALHGPLHKQHPNTLGGSPGRDHDVSAIDLSALQSTRNLFRSSSARRKQRAAKALAAWMVDIPGESERDPRKRGPRRRGIPHQRDNMVRVFFFSVCGSVSAYVVQFLSVVDRL